MEIPEPSFFGENARTIPSKNGKQAGRESEGPNPDRNTFLEKQKVSSLGKWRSHDATRGIPF